VLFGPVTSLINAKIAEAVMLLVVNHMLDSNSSGQAIFRCIVAVPFARTSCQ